MSSYTSILKDIERLPPDAQQQIYDFVDFIRSRYENQVTNQSELLNTQQKVEHLENKKWSSFMDLPLADDDFLVDRPDVIADEGRFNQ